MNTAYRASITEIAEAADVEHRRDWRNRRERFRVSEDCQTVPAAATAPCRLIAGTPARARQEEERRQRWAARVVAASRIAPGLDALQNYAQALENISNRDDRKAFDEAIDNLSTKVSALASTVGAAAGAGPVGPVAGAVATVAGRIVGAVYDIERLAALENGVTRAAPSIEKLAGEIGTAMGLMVEAQRSLLQQRLANSEQHASRNPAAYPTILAEAEMDVQALNSLRDVHPQQLADSLINAHQELREALADQSRQVRPVMEAIQKFAGEVRSLVEAMNKLSSTSAN